MPHRYSFQFLIVSSLLLTLGLTVQTAQAQPSNSSLRFSAGISIPAQDSNGVTLQNAWAGGLWAPQYGEIDLNGDGAKDLFVFSRGSNTVSTYLRTPSPPYYTYAPEYEQAFPSLYYWALLRDNTGDGKPELFTQIGASVLYYIPTPNTPADQPRFTLKSSQLKADYDPSAGSLVANVYVPSSDLPAIDDLDGDGDLDILAFDILGSVANFYECTANPVGGEPQYTVTTTCWGRFRDVSLCDSFLIAVSGGCKGAVSVPDTLATPEPAWLSTLDSTNKTQHAGGNAMLTLDEDGDGDRDLLLGALSCLELTYFENTAIAGIDNMTSYQIGYPTVDPAHFERFHAPFLVDVDGDGKRDLISTLNETTLTDKWNKSWYYKNTSTTAAFDFSLQQTDWLHSTMLDLGLRTAPVFGDLDNDGDDDLLVSALDSTGLTRFVLLENIANDSAPSYRYADNDWMNLSDSGYVQGVPALGDLNNDGLLDLIIGNQRPSPAQSGSAAIYYQQANGQFTYGQFGLPGVVSISFNPSPQLIDYDGDGKLDLLLGDRNGRVSLHRNTGTQSVPNFTLIEDSLTEYDFRPNGYFTGYTSPRAADFDGDDTLDLAVGNQLGQVFIFRNAFAPNRLFAKQFPDSNWLYNATYDTLTGNKALGEYVQLAIRDLNNDTAPDLMIGAARGGLRFFLNGAVDSSLGIAATPTAPALNFAVFPNPIGAQSTQLSVLLSDDFSFAATHAATYTLTDIFGRQVRQGPLRARLSSVSVEGLARGTYALRVQNGRGLSGVKLVVVE